MRPTLHVHITLHARRDYTNKNWFYPANNGLVNTVNEPFYFWPEEVKQGYGWLQPESEGFDDHDYNHLPVPPLWVNNNNPVMLPYGQVLTGISFIPTICPWCGYMYKLANGEYESANGNILNVGVQSCTLSVNQTSGELHRSMECTHARALRWQWSPIAMYG